MTKTRKVPVARRVLETDLRRVVTAAHFGRLTVSSGGQIWEKVPHADGGSAKYRRELPTREAVALGLLTLLPSDRYEPTDAGRARFGLNGG